MAEAYIVAAARTATGKRNGALSGWHPVDLAATVIDALLDRSGADPALVDDLIMGCVSHVAEQSNDVARNAVLASRLPERVPGVAIDRQCGSSQQAVHFAAQAVMSGTQDVVIAAGIESMSRVPMFLPMSLPRKNGFGIYMSPNILKRYPQTPEFSQFMGAELLADKHGFSKEQLDTFALQSHQRASAASKAGLFKDEIVAVEARTLEGGPTGAMHTADEGIRHDATLEGIASVKLLQEGGKISAANASQISDGAAGLMVVNERGLKAIGAKPLARIHQMTVMGDDPVVMLEGPLPATLVSLKKAGLSIGDIGHFEVNEAFAPVPLAWLKHTGADPARLNPLGGAIALGHPLGASGAKLMTTLVYALQRSGQRYGLQTMCEGGGMANVTIIERL